MCVRPTTYWVMICPDRLRDIENFALTLNSAFRNSKSDKSLKCKQRRYSAQKGEREIHFCLKKPLSSSVAKKEIFHACSRMTSRALLSVRSPRKAGCRISPSLVHSVNFTSPTSFGISHVVAFSSFTFWSKGFLSRGNHYGCNAIPDQIPESARESVEAIKAGLGDQTQAN